MRQGELFGPPKRDLRPTHERMTSDGRKLVRVLRAAAKGGLVNGMSKAQLRRHAPARLPKVTIGD
jgi:hypothetical protein